MVVCLPHSRFICTFLHCFQIELCCNACDNESYFDVILMTFGAARLFQILYSGDDISREPLRFWRRGGRCGSELLRNDPFLSSFVRNTVKSIDGEQDWENIGPLLAALLGVLWTRGLWQSGAYAFTYTNTGSAVSACGLRRAYGGEICWTLSSLRW